MMQVIIEEFPPRHIRDEESSTLIILNYVLRYLDKGHKEAISNGLESNPNEDETSLKEITSREEYSFKFNLAQVRFLAIEIVYELQKFTGKRLPADDNLANTAVKLIGKVLAEINGKRDSNN